MKQKIQDEVAKANMERDAPLTSPEHEALLSQMRLELAQAHTELLESTTEYRNSMS